MIDSQLQTIQFVVVARNGYVSENVLGDSRKSGLSLNHEIEKKMEYRS
jgi:hypothetical protein